MKTEEKTGKIKQNPADLTIKTLCNSNKQLSQVYKLGKDSIIGLLCDASWSRLARFAIEREMSRTPGLRVTLPNLADEKLIKSVL